MDNPELQYIVLSFDRDLIIGETRDKLIRLDSSVAYADRCTRFGKKMAFGFELKDITKQELLDLVFEIVPAESRKGMFFRGFRRTHPTSYINDEFKGFMDRRIEESREHGRYSHKKDWDN